MGPSHGLPERSGSSDGGCVPGARDGISWRLPAAALRDHVVCYSGFQTEFAMPRRRLELPIGLITLVFSFQEGLRLSAAGSARAAYRAMLTGPRVFPTVGEHSGAVYGIEVNVTLTGAYRLFGIPMRHFESAYLDLADVLGADSDRLTDRLRDAPGWPERFDVLDRALTGRLDTARTVAPEVGWAVSRLCTQRGGPRTLAAITDETGWSPRLLRARFQEQVGLSPKAMARVGRLQQALRMLAAGDSGALTAVLCGFHDQAHLSREVKAMTGLTPSVFARVRGGLPPGSPLDRVPGRMTSVVLEG
ncbi:helix-turn-helix transcriptional regulator [Streptomyces sp. NPDC006691]|uniref:helix-turn-helix transcriptional regulator n=1 Tax=Streptomyces sp. NPDC006691 TaxID=3364757 RepID=UPI0036931FCC